MTKDSPEMETYSRLLSHLQESCKQKKAEIYDEFIADIAILLSSNSDILRLIENDLKYILPSVLLYSVYKDVGVRNAAIKSFDTFTNIVNKKPSIKNEPWYKDMECTLIAQEFSSHLIKLVEVTDNTWPHIWSFVISLIVHDEQVHGVAINSLLKVVEIAFKLSRKFETVLEKAYYCWNRLIDIFSVHPRIVTSQKLIELLVRPLSTNLSLKCPKLKLETWSNLVHKVGFACVNTKCKLVIEPFIDFAYLKDNDSLCHLYPLDCIVAFRDIVKEKKLYKFCVTKIMSALLTVFESGRSDDLNEYIIEIWTALIDNTKDIEKANVNDYITELINKIPQIIQLDRPGLNDAIIKVTLEKKLFCSENMKMFILAQVPIMPIISSFMSHCDFQKNFFLPIVDNLLEYFLEAQNKKSQSSVELEIWDLMCEVFILWLKRLPLPQESSAIDVELLCSLLLVPLLSKQWSVPVQKTWNSVLEYTQIIVPSNNYLSQFIDKFYKELSESHISAEFSVEFCTFLTNKDKSVFKSLMPTFNFISKSLPSKDPKPLMDLLVLIENSIKYVPKQELIKLLTELMSNSNSYGQPYDLRIKTKITKLQRKLFTLKDPNESSSKEQDGQQSKSQEKEQQNGQKTRSPLMAHSNFLHRLAKAEEKKVKKRASMSSIFGDIHQNEEVETSSPERSGEHKSPKLLTPKPSPLNHAPIDGKDSKNDVNKPEVKEVEEKKLPIKQTPVTDKDTKNDPNKEEVKVKESEEKKLPLNGRSSPAIPAVVTVVTTPNRKRPIKQPEIVLSQESKKSIPKPTPPPPSYFDDEAMDYVIVPPKPKSTPLTEHQKEMMSKRRSDIPALYQDLSQDTQSMNSQSIKEIITLKEIKLNDTAKSSDVITSKDDETNNTSMKTDEENNKKEQTEKVSIDNGVVDKIGDDSQEIINVTQPTFDSGVNLSLTPTKHIAALPTQKNLLNKFNLLESDENGDVKKIDEEDEVEKENKIVNIEEAALQKVTPIKRRSLRKSTNKYFTKKAEETSKTKTKKEISESTVNSELMSKGKPKKISETVAKNVDNASSLKLKNSDSQDSLKESEKNESSESERKCTDTVEECLSKSSQEITEETKTSSNLSETEKTDIEQNVIEQVDNSSNKIDNELSEIAVPLNNTIDDDKLDNISSKSETCEMMVPSKNDGTDLPAQAVSVMSASESINLKEINESSLEENSESKTKNIDVSNIDNSKETGSASIKIDTSQESMDISEEECPISNETKNMISEEVLKTDVNSERGCSQIKCDPETEIKLNESENVRSDVGNEGSSTVEQSKDSLNNCETSNVLSPSNDNDVMIVDECKTDNIENLNISNENNVDIEIKVEEPEDIDHNSSGDSVAASWSMVTPEKKSRKRKVTEVTNAEKFSPKLLRSKRLSLTKLTPDNCSEKNKKNGSVSKVAMKGNKASEADTIVVKKTGEDKRKVKRSSSIEIINTVETNAQNSSIKPNTPDNMDSKTSSPESEVSSERKASKRKNPEQVVTPPSKPKRAKTDSEEANQDSLSLLKNSTVKPRKKKIIKSNIKASPNNLEQWLIKSGKSVVKKTLLSSNDQNNLQSESKIVNNNSEVQISSSEPKKIIVEMSPVPKGIDNSPKTSEENATEMQPIDVITIKEEEDLIEIDVVTVDEADPANLSICEGICTPIVEPEVSKSVAIDPVDDIETIERQFLEAIKRRAKEEEEQNSQKSKKDNLSKPKPKRRSEDEDDDEEELLTESLKCDETELERTSLELDRNSNASRVKLESMIYAKYKTTLRRPHRRKRLLRRVKKSDDENELDEEVEEEEETFEERRERLVTPFRPSGGRSAQMVKMVTSEEEGPPVTPVRRKSITPLQLTENWPEGRCEQWVPCVPTPPGKSPSLSILKRKISPVPSPTSSPNNKKKRVSFLDPPVSKGLLYSKGSDNIGQVQHANIPPVFSEGKKPVWKGFEGEIEDKSSSDTSKVEESDEGFVAVEAEDELTAIQEFLNSTPDAPWKDTPLAGEISKIPGILSCSDPVHNIISRIASPGSEKMLSEELLKLKINTIGGFCSLTVSDIMKLSIRPAKVSTLYNVLKDYFQCQPSSSKKSPKVKLPEDSPKSLEDGEKMDFVETQIEITTLGIEMGVQVDPSEICSDDTFTFSQMSQKTSQNTQDLILTPPVVREVELYSDSQEDIKIPTRDEIGLMFQSDVFVKRAAPFVTFNFLSKLSAAAAEYFRSRPD
ncbi:unnamed protein product [Nezara viridula]|uniref:Telomere-associated protein RIF1 n=1 Tax=Nezara viridula TaxID=85310 RepID=A0A9P0MRZ6_NEZVI|nr:unnamed protein product [Nezara viridula]